MVDSHETRLVSLVESSDWFMEILRTARSVDLPDWAVAAGAVRTLVWDHLHGFPSPSRINDVDVLFFDPARRSEEAIVDVLSARLPAHRWDAKNQAFIHEWYLRKLKLEITPFRSTEEGIAGFVETATAVGIRLERDDSVTVIAPLGLADLFELRLRPNSASPDPQYFDVRVAEKDFLERWPKLRILGR